MTTAPKSSLPLSALASQACVAFTIEFDNEFERRTPHRTTNYGSTPGFPRAPWLVSMPIWLRFLQHVPLDGIAIVDLHSRLAMSGKGLKIWLARLSRWWGYLAIDDPAGNSAPGRITPAAMVRPTAGGRKAIEVWQTLVPFVESRWRERFGDRAVAALEDGLTELAGKLGPAVPSWVTILEDENDKVRAARLRLPPRELALPELLAKILVAFAAEFDANSAAPLALCANVLRVTPDSGIRVRDLPALTCLSPEGIADGLRQLARRRLGTVRSDPAGGRARFLAIAPEASRARDAYPTLAAQIENDWKKRFGAAAVARLRASLESIVLDPDGLPSLLLRGLTPHPGGWRAQLPPLAGLPHFPMVCHRGGFPDGS